MPKNKQVKGITDIEPLTEKVSTATRAALEAILDKANEGRPLLQKDVGLMGETYTTACESIPKHELAKLYDVAPQAVNRWLSLDCPRNPDDTFNLGHVIKWREQYIEKKKESTPLQEQKLKAEIRLKEQKADEFDEQYILRSEHEQVLVSRARAFKDFWPTAVRKNGHLFVGQQSIDAIQHLLMEFGKQLMKAWTGGSDK